LTIVRFIWKIEGVDGRPFSIAEESTISDEVAVAGMLTFKGVHPFIQDFGWIVRIKKQKIRGYTHEQRFGSAEKATAIFPQAQRAKSRRHEGFFPIGWSI
jgi:hypothetical protein